MSGATPAFRLSPSCRRRVATPEASAAYRELLPQARQVLPLAQTSCSLAPMPKKAASRGPLRSMRSSESFREFVLEQLVGVHGIRARGMFGGVGLYADDAFFL